VRAIFPGRPYVSLERSMCANYARSDPRGFLAEYGQGAVIDEVQNALTSSATCRSSRCRPDPGRFILTGWQHFGLSHAIAQSLAGRTASCTASASHDELRRFPAVPSDLFSTLFMGALSAHL